MDGLELSFAHNFIRNFRFPYESEWRDMTDRVGELISLTPHPHVTDQRKLGHNSTLKIALHAAAFEDLEEICHDKKVSQQVWWSKQMKKKIKAKKEAVEYRNQ